MKTRLENFGKVLEMKTSFVLPEALKYYCIFQSYAAKF